MGRVNITNACDYKREAKHHEGGFGVCLITSNGKDQIAKARSLGSKCRSLVDKNLDSSSANLSNNGYGNYMLL